MTTTLYGRLVRSLNLVCPLLNVTYIPPFYRQLVYQTTVFFSRSSISLGLPPLPATLLPAPSLVQALILPLLAIESAAGIFSEDSQGLSFSFVFLLISIEGICGGLA